MDYYYYFYPYSSRQVTGLWILDPLLITPAAFLANTRNSVSVSFTESGNGEEVVRYNGVVALEPATVSNFTDWLTLYDVAHDLAAAIIHLGRPDQ